MRLLNRLPYHLTQLSRASIGSVYKRRRRSLHLSRCKQQTSLGPNDNHDQYFRYTSGRWLYDEEAQLSARYVWFDVGALQRVAERAVGSRCVEMKKLPEGLNNKIFSLQMEDGQEILARIPNPTAGHPHYVVASEVATLDFVRALCLFFFFPFPEFHLLRATEDLA